MQAEEVGMTRGTRIALIAGVIAAAIVAFIIVSPGGGDDDSNTKTSTTPNTKTSTTQSKKKTAPSFTQIRVVGGKPVGGITRITVHKGDPVRFTVSSDVADEIHVHGYDFMKDVPAGGRVRFNFPATISGSFIVELEGLKEQIASLKVEP
jgi:hypothetical protein